MRNNTPTPARGWSAAAKENHLPAEQQKESAETGQSEGGTVTSPARVVIQAAIGFACAVIGVGAFIVAGMLS
jgi:hypothetical protein